MTALLNRFPLRVTIAVLLAVLVGLGLMVAGTGAVLSLRSYLMRRLDQQITQTAAIYVQRPPNQALPPAPDAAARPPSEYYIRFSSADGTRSVVESSPLRYPTPDLPGWPQQELPNRGAPTTVSSAGQQWRVASEPLPGGVGYVTVAAPQGEINATVEQLAVLEIVIGSLVVVAVASLGYLLVKVTLRPLTEVEDTAGQIAATADSDGLSRRVPTSDTRSEVGRLAKSFNTMIDGIQTAFAQREASEAQARASEDRMRRFVADASHELRTPLTTIRGFAELYGQGAVPDPDLPALMRRIEGEAQRMGVLVEDLLLLARLDQQRPLERAQIDLLEAVTESVSGIQAGNPGRSIDVDVRIGVPPEITGDPLRIRQIVDNLLSNAVRHTPDASAIHVRLASDNGWAVLTVGDEGPGMTPEAADRVFERFFRVDESRTRASGGSGLGLAIVRSLVIAHGGSISLRTSPQTGSEFTVQLPLSGAPRDR